MAHNIIRRDGIVTAFRRALALGSTREEAAAVAGQTFGLDADIVLWVVDEDESPTLELKTGERLDLRAPWPLPGATR
jgi:hypothetical protein